MPDFRPQLGRIERGNEHGPIPPHFQVAITVGKDDVRYGQIVAGVPNQQAAELLCRFANEQDIVNLPTGTEGYVKFLGIERTASRSGRSIVHVEWEGRVEQRYALQEVPRESKVFGVSRLVPVHMVGLRPANGKDSIDGPLQLSESDQARLEKNRQEFDSAFQRLSELAKPHLVPDNHIMPEGLIIPTPDIERGSSLRVNISFADDGVWRSLWRFNNDSGEIVIEPIADTADVNPRGKKRIDTWFKKWGDSSFEITDLPQAISVLGTLEPKTAPLSPRPLPDRFNQEYPKVSWLSKGKKFQATVGDEAFKSADLELAAAPDAEITENNGKLFQCVDLRSLGIDGPVMRIIGTGPFASLKNDNLTEPRDTTIAVYPATITPSCPTNSRAEVTRRLQAIVELSNEAHQYCSTVLEEVRKIKIKQETNVCFELTHLLPTILQIPADQFKCVETEGSNINMGYYSKGYLISSDTLSIRMIEEMRKFKVPKSIIALMGEEGFGYTRDRLLAAIDSYLHNLAGYIGSWRPECTIMAEQDPQLYQERPIDTNEILQGFRDISPDEIKHLQAALDGIDDILRKPAREAAARLAEAEAVAAAEKGAWLERTVEVSEAERTAYMSMITEAKTIAYYIQNLQGDQASKVRPQLLAIIRDIDIIREKCNEDRIERDAIDGLRKIQNTITQILSRQLLTQEHPSLRGKIQIVREVVNAADGAIRNHEMVKNMGFSEEQLQGVLHQYLEALPQAMAKNESTKDLLTTIINTLYE